MLEAYRQTSPETVFRATLRAKVVLAWVYETFAELPVKVEREQDATGLGGGADIGHFFKFAPGQLGAVDMLEVACVPGRV